MTMSKVMKADIRQPSFFKHFSKSVADYARVKRLTVDMAEYEATIN